MTRSVDLTYEMRQKKLQEFRKAEQTVRRNENVLSEKQQAIKQTRTALSDAKATKMEHDQKVRACQ